MEENFNGQNQPRTYGEESKLYESGQTAYHQPQGNGNPQPDSAGANYNQSYGQGGGQANYNQPNYNQPYGQQGGQANYNQPNYNQPYNGGYGIVQHGPVKDVFCYILLVIMPLRIILEWVMAGNVLGTINYEYLMYETNVPELPAGYMLMSLFSMLLSIAYLVFVILDIVMISRQKYKIVGLILFAIFLPPGYYIWRAYILNRKKTIPIIYTIVYSVLMLASWIGIFYSVFQMLSRVMTMMNF